MNNVIPIRPVCPGSDDSEEYRVTPAVQEKLTQAAVAIRQAIAATEAASEATVPDSDAECRCAETLSELEEALYRMEWTVERDG